MPKIRDWGVVNFLQERVNGQGVAAKVLELAADTVTGGTFGKVKDFITGSSELTETEKQLALVQLSQDHEAYLAELKDRQDARAMTVSINESANSSWFARNFVFLLQSVLVLSAILFGVMLVFVEIPEANRRIVEMFADVFLFAGALTAINFSLGSSGGSKQKDSQISTMLGSMKK